MTVLCVSLQASLMDQDLSLMKQLLTLNETIEELKWQRRYYYSKTSVRGSSQDLDHSDWSVSDTEMYDSDEDIATKTATTTTTTTASHSQVSSSRQLPVISLSSTTTNRRKCETVQAFDATSGLVVKAQSSDSNNKRYVDTQILVNGSSIKIYHGEQDSFDSGIHESTGEEDSSMSV